MTRRESPRQAQVRTSLSRAIAADLEIYTSLMGRKVVLEESSESSLGSGISGISIATLRNHGSKLVVLENYARYDVPISCVLERTPKRNIFTPRYEIRMRTIDKSDIASIQSLEDVLQGRKFEDLFDSSEGN